MRILYVNNLGAGFGDYIDVTPGTTVAQFFQERQPDHKPDDFLIRVNRQVAAADQVLAEGDRISMTPVKIEGA